MTAREPAWWYSRAPGWQAAVLTPAAVLYGSVARYRYRATTPYRGPLPVLCVGNFTAGGTGKTPFALALADLVAKLGRQPWFLSRGYGGTLRGPQRLEPDRHSAAEAGDEPMLLARRAPVVVARDRRAGAIFIANCAPADAVIIMDDGLQNPSVAKDLSIALIDRRRGLGNGKVIPAGPLRMPIAFQAGLADVIVATGAESGQDPVVADDLAKLGKSAIIQATTAPEGDTAWLRERPVVAFAGIADPDRFFRLISALGASVAEVRAFGDHHTFSDADAVALAMAADRLGAELVTTEKDYVRLAAGTAAVRDLARRVRVVKIRTILDTAAEAALTSLVRRAIGR